MSSIRRQLDIRSLSQRDSGHRQHHHESKSAETLRRLRLESKRKWSSSSRRLRSQHELRTSAKTQLKRSRLRLLWLLRKQLLKRRRDDVSGVSADSQKQRRAQRRTPRLFSKLKLNLKKTLLPSHGQRKRKSKKLLNRKPKLRRSRKLLLHHHQRRNLLQ